MNLLLLVGLMLSGTLSASTDFLFSTQHITITRNNAIGRMHEVFVKHDLNRKYSVGINGSYLERFSFFEKRAGAFVGLRATDKLTLQGHYHLGEGDNEILPREQRALSAYYALGSGFTPYAVYRDHRYSQTRVHMLNLGTEIEKIPNVILIPQVMIGNATFDGPASTETIHNYGLRAMYYVEKKFTAFVFGFRGKEATQGIVGVGTNELVDTRTGGLGGSWFFKDNLRAELVFDHTDYEQLKNQFLTTTFNLYWTVE